MAKQKKYDFFISYRRANGGDARAQMIRSELIKRGYRVFLDLRNLKPGEPFDEELLKRIEEAKYFIASLTPNSLDRCYQDGDWVYREIEHAFASGKTIVPVTTPDFWRSQEKPSLDGKNAVSQEKAEEIARTLDKLSRLQAIEAGPKHFDAAMDDLQGTFPLSRRRKLMVVLSRKLVAFALLAALAAGTLAATAYCKYRAEQKVAEEKAERDAAEFAAASEEVAQLMGVELATMESHLSTVAGSVDDAWEQFAAKCRANPDGVDLYDDKLLEEIERSREYFDKNVQKDVVSPSTETLEVLRKNGVDMADIKTFYDMFLPCARQGMINYLDGVETCAKEVKDLLLLASKEADELGLTKEERDEWHTFHSNIDARDAFVRETYRVQELQFQICYVGYLDVLTTTPKSVYSFARPIFEKTSLFAGIPMEQSREDLTNARKNYEEQVDRKLLKVSRAILDEEDDIEKENKARLERANEGEGRLDALEVKKSENEALKNKLDETIAETQAIYDDAAAKFALVEGDSLGVCWGKILCLASFLRMNMAVEITPTQKILSDITARIDQCVELCAEEATNLDAFATAAKRYFTLLAEGKIEDAGIIVCFVENDAEHPNLRPGDIIWKVDGNLVHNYDEYEKNFTDGKFGHKIERLRFDADGEPAFETYETVEGSPRVALMPFTEEE